MDLVTEGGGKDIRINLLIWSQYISIKLQTPSTCSLMKNF